MARPVPSEGDLGPMPKLLASLDSGPSLEPACDFQEQVLQGLSAVHTQLEGLAHGQRHLEAALRKLHLDVNPHSLDVAGRDSLLLPKQITPNPSGGSAEVVRLTRRRSMHLSTRRASLEGDHPPPDLSPHEQVQGFWPRKEFQRQREPTIRPGPNYSFQLVHRSTTEVRKRISHIALHPDSWKRALFDIISILLLLYDSIFIPYQLAFFVPFKGWVAEMAWITLAFWTLDLFLGFITGYHQRDTLMLDVATISKRYLRTWFLPNLLLCFVDLLGNTQAAAEVGAEHEEYSTQHQFVRIARFVKLNRIWKLSGLLTTGKTAEVWDWLGTSMRLWGVHEQFTFMSRVCKLVFYILWVNHLGGCLWFALFNEEARERYAGDSEETGDLFDYMLGFYWSANTMIAGGALIPPRTNVELLLTVFCAVFGFTFSSVLISSLLTVVMEYQEANKEQYNRLNNLRQFLYQHNIDSKLALPVVKQADERMQRRKHISEGECDALMLLSPLMRAELWYRIYKPCFLEKPFFAALHTLDDGLVRDICVEALQHGTVPPGTGVFEPDRQAVGAYFIYYGTLDYVPASYSSEMLSEGEDHDWNGGRGSSEELPMVKQGDWVCEIAFWVHWLHRGWLSTRTASEIMTVEVEKFLRVMARHADSLDLVRSYSGIFYDLLREETNFSDIECVPHSSVVAAMPLENRILMSQMAMDVLVTKHQWTGHLFQSKGMQSLKDEIDSGASDLMLLKDGVRRVVTIVALSLRRRRDGAVLAEIAKLKEDHLLPGCQTPGTKVKKGEFPKAAVERLISSRLHVLSGSTHLGHHSVDSEERVSRSFGLKSTYMRTLFEADLEEEPAAYMQPVPRKGRRRISGSSGQRQSGGTGIQRITRFTQHTLDITQRTIDLVAEGDPSDGYEAFIFRPGDGGNGDTTFIFAWLQPEDFQLLSSPKGQMYLKAWVEQLDIEELRQAPAAAARPLREGL